VKEVNKVAEENKGARFATCVRALRDVVEKGGEDVVLRSSRPPAIWKSLTTTKRRTGGVVELIQTKSGQTRSSPTFMSPCAMLTPRSDSVRRTSKPKPKPAAAAKAAYAAGPAAR
jgi:hypothetical protein